MADSLKQRSKNKYFEEITHMKLSNPKHLEQDTRWH